jgi:hypothetical protein
LDSNPMPISALGLSAWPRDALAKAGYTTVNEIEGLSDAHLLKLRHLGAKGLREIRNALRNTALEPSPPGHSPPDLAVVDFADDLLNDIPSPDAAVGQDPQLLSLLDAALEVALSHRDSRLVRHRMSVPQGGPSKTLQVTGNEFGISRERVRQIMLKTPRRLVQSTDPQVLLLARYVGRTLRELSPDDPVEALARYAALAFPDSDPLFAIVLFLALRDGSPFPQRKQTAEAVALYNRFKHEARELERAEFEQLRHAERVSIAAQRLDRWIVNACWPSEPTTESGRWVPKTPGRDAGTNETSCEHDSPLLGRRVNCESETERRFFSQLDLSEKSSWYVEQPFSVAYTDRNGKQRNYWPDALIRLDDGRWLLVEVKPLFFFLGENDQRKWSAAAKRCSSRGIGFLVVDPSLDLTLAEVAQLSVPSSLNDAMKSFDQSSSPIPWHSSRGVASRSGATFLQFAAWVLQTGRASTPTPSWSITHASAGNRVLDWI